MSFAMALRVNLTAISPSLLIWCLIRANLVKGLLVTSQPQQNSLLFLHWSLSLLEISLVSFLGNFDTQIGSRLKPLEALVPGLWLDHSEISGKLNQMRVVKPGEKTNVCLAWEGVNEVKGEKSFCQYWRALVIATRDIMPFDQLIRPP